jgi:hypothetical protein
MSVSWIKAGSDAHGIPEDRKESNWSVNDFGMVYNCYLRGILTVTLMPRLHKSIPVVLNIFRRINILISILNKCLTKSWFKSTKRTAALMGRN